MEWQPCQFLYCSVLVLFRYISFHIFGNINLVLSSTWISKIIIEYSLDLITGLVRSIIQLNCLRKLLRLQCTFQISFSMHF